jgi:hypothetical protein
MAGKGMTAVLTADKPAEVSAWPPQGRLSWRDSTLIEDTIGGFFGAYNDMDYDGCMDRVAKLAGGDGGVPGFLRVVRKGLLREARKTTGPVVIQSVGRMEITCSRATAVLHVVLQGEVRKKRVNLVKQGGYWRIDWDSISDPCVLKALRKIKGEA